jgi:hypothetical protein
MRPTTARLWRQADPRLPARVTLATCSGHPRIPWRATAPHTQCHARPAAANGTLGTVKDVKDERNLTIDTRGAKEREVSVDTGEFNDLRLGYAQHVYKAQGLTANSALTLIGDWQTDRERAYVALTRAREQTNIYTAREDLGRQGMNVEAIDRLAERIAESNAQQASITREPAADRGLAQSQEPKLETAHDLKAGQSIEPGVGAFSPHGPDPSPETNPEQDRDLSLGIE